MKIGENIMDNMKITKAIRFKLESNSSNNLIQGTIDNLGKNNDFNLSNFVQNLYEFMRGLNKGLCYKSKKDDEYYINTNLVLKSEWMKIYAKQEFAEFKQRVRKTGQYTVGDYNITNKITDKRSAANNKAYVLINSISSTP